MGEAKDLILKKKLKMSVNSLNKKVYFSLVVTTILFMFLFAGGEIYVRYFWDGVWMDPGVVKKRPFEYQASLFSRSAFPQKEQVMVIRGNVNIYINEKGYRGRNFQVNKKEGTIRIIFYGGSAVFDADGGNWPRRVEKIIKQSGFDEVEVINAGIPGHASFDSLGRLFSEGHLFNPDYVVLYNAWNDIKYFKMTKPLLRLFRPSEKSVDPRVQYHGMIDRALCRCSKQYLLVREKYLLSKYRLGPEGPKPSGEYGSETSSIALRQFRLNVEMFVDAARNIGATPVLMTQARLVARNNTQEQRKKIQYDYVLLTHEALCEAFEKTDEIIADVAEKKSVFLIDASKQITGKDYVFDDHVHLTASGSEELADITARRLMELLEKKQMEEKERRAQ